MLPALTSFRGYHFWNLLLEMTAIWGCGSSGPRGRNSARCEEGERGVALSLNPRQLLCLCLWKKTIVLAVEQWMPICCAAYLGRDLPRRWSGLVPAPCAGTKTSSACLSSDIHSLRSSVNNKQTPALPQPHPSAPQSSPLQNSFQTYHPIPQPIEAFIAVPLGGFPSAARNPGYQHIFPLTNLGQSLLSEPEAGYLVGCSGLFSPKVHHHYYYNCLKQRWGESEGRRGEGYHLRAVRSQICFETFPMMSCLDVLRGCGCETRLREKERPWKASPIGKGSRLLLLMSLLPGLSRKPTQGCDCLSLNLECTSIISFLNISSKDRSSKAKRCVSFSFCRRATCRVSRVTVSTLLRYSETCRSRLMIFCANWFSVIQSCRASWSSSFLSLSLALLGCRTPMISFLALMRSISSLASSISRKMLPCYSLTPSTVSWRARTRAGSISSSMRWKSSPMRRLRSTVLTRLSSVRAVAASERSLLMSAAILTSSVSHLRTRWQTSLKLELNSSSLFSICTLVFSQTYFLRRSSLMCFLRAVSWNWHSVMPSAEASRCACSWASMRSILWGSMLEDSWKARMFWSMRFSASCRYISTSSSLILSSILVLNSVSFQLTLVSTSRRRSVTSKERISIFCCRSMESFTDSPLVSSRCVCSELIFSLICAWRSASVTVSLPSSLRMLARSRERDSLIWLSLREKSCALALILSVGSSWQPSLVLRSLMRLGSQWMPALISAMVSVSWLSVTRVSMSFWTRRRAPSWDLTEMASSLISACCLAKLQSSSNYCMSWFSRLGVVSPFPFSERSYSWSQFCICYYCYRLSNFRHDSTRPFSSVCLMRAVKQPRVQGGW